jgi:hypothetical protein
VIRRDPHLGVEWSHLVARLLAVVEHVAGGAGRPTAKRSALVMDAEVARAVSESQRSRKAKVASELIFERPSRPMPEIRRTRDLDPSLRTLS